MPLRLMRHSMSRMWKLCLQRMWSRFFFTPSHSKLQNRQMRSDSKVVFIGSYCFERSPSSGTERGSFELLMDRLISLKKSDVSVFIDLKMLLRDSSGWLAR